MAKSKPSETITPDQTPAVKPNADQIKSAMRCICAVTGCGRLEANARLEKLTSGQVIKIAELEQSKKRREAIAIIY